MNRLSLFAEKLKAYIMPVAMLLGVIFHHQAALLSFLVPYLIFVMLFLTYLKISWREIKITKMHLWLILIQLAGSVLVYYLIQPYNAVLAQGVMICILAPTATSAPVITDMLKGNVTSLTSYSLMSNLTLVIMAPLFFSWIGFHQTSFYVSAFQIIQRIALLLLMPLLLSVLINRMAPKAAIVLQSKSYVSLYLWSIALVIVSGRTVEFILLQDQANKIIEILLAICSFLVCVLQFWIGRKIGRKFEDTVAGGQGLGQKNTILAIWMAQVYLNPIASIGPGAYVLWQNIINSWQVWRNRKNLN